MEAFLDVERVAAPVFEKRNKHQMYNREWRYHTQRMIRSLFGSKEQNMLEANRFIENMFEYRQRKCCCLQIQDCVEFTQCPHHISLSARERVVNFTARKPHIPLFRCMPRDGLRRIFFFFFKKQYTID